MKNINMLFVLLIASFLVFSCKKKDPAPEPVKDTTIKYPITYNDKLNVLSDSSFVLASMKEYSLAVTLPATTSIKVVYKPSKGSAADGIGLVMLTNDGWNVQNEWPDSMVLTAKGSDKTINVNYMMGPPRSADFFIYENGAKEPTRTKMVRNF